MTVLKITAKRDRRRAGRRFLKGQPVRIKAGALKKHERAAIEADPALEVFELEPEGAPQDQKDAPEASAEAPKPGKGRSGGRRKGAKANKR